jgi:ribonuclease P protein component
MREEYRFVDGKKLRCGNSVVRHRVSRRLRAILAERMPHLGEPRRVVVRALAPAASAAFQDLDRAVGRCLGEAAR